MRASDENCIALRMSRTGVAPMRRNGEERVKYLGTSRAGVIHVIRELIFHLF